MFNLSGKLVVGLECIFQMKSRYCKTANSKNISHQPQCTSPYIVYLRTAKYILEHKTKVAATVSKIVVKK